MSLKKLRRMTVEDSRCFAAGPGLLDARSYRVSCEDPHSLLQALGCALI